jgi:hypothetical protein
MPTKFSDTVKGTPERPYVLTHRQTGERYGYSEKALARTRDMYRRVGERLEAHYTIAKEYEPS